MELKIKSFDSLTVCELYEILKARCAVFIVEQNCPYQDIDDVDHNAVHIWLEEKGNIKAYLRVFDRDETCAQLGRVITTERGKGFGGQVLREGIKACRDILRKDKIYIEAQCYATGFYEKEGFAAFGEEFLEDGIPHICMMRE